MENKNPTLKSPFSTTMVVLPMEAYDTLIANSQKTLDALENLKLVAPAEFMSRKEFMAKARIASTKMHELIKSGRLHYRKVGRMVYVPTSELNRFYNGEI